MGRTSVPVAGATERGPQLTLGILHAFHLAWLTIKRGLMHWAQILCGWGGSCVEDQLGKLRHDAYFIRRWSPGVELQVISKTVGVPLALGRT